MGCNDYNLHLEGSEGNESPTPEYKIYLDGVGVNGYSPTVDIVNENTASFQIQTNDINGSELTSPIPKLSYLQSDYVSNTSLASTLANYSTTSEIASAYLKVDGSNADNPITINNISLRGYTGGIGKISTTGTLQLHGSNTNIYGTSVGIDVKANSIDFGNWSTGKYLEADTTVKYGTSSTKYEIATVNDIGNGTITLTQGGVTKGTFTTNQSGNTTINLDAGGGSITNPLEIEDADSNNFISIGVNSSGANIRLGNTQGLSFNSYLIGNATAPLGLANGAFGDKIIKLNIDSTTLDVNNDGELTVIGGGGTIYTAGTGIDITNNVISVDDTVAMKTDIPDTTYMVTTNTAQTISGVKTFSSETHHLGVITFDSAMLNPIIRGMSGSSHRNMIYRMGNDSAIIVGNSNDTIDLKGSGTRPTYNSSNLALYSDIPTNSTYVDLTSSQTITGKKSFSGAELETNNIITLKNNAIIRGLYGTNSYSTYLIGSNGSLLVGNEGHGITLRGNTTRPVYRTGSTDYNIALSGDIPSLATTSTAGIVQPDGSTITVNNGVISATPARNVGELVHSIVPLTDAGLHLLDGALISGSGSYADFVDYISGLVSTYPDLFETEANWQTSVTTYGVCGKFVYDSTNNTVRLPKITGIIEGTVDATALGDLVQAGLPNITGGFNLAAGTGIRNDATVSGSFIKQGSSPYSPTYSTADSSSLSVQFEASLSSSIYGNSTTVQPQTIKAFIYIVIATSAKTDIQVDIDEIATDLNGKADTDLSNITTTGKALISSLGMPSAGYALSTLAQNTDYTAAESGYFYIQSQVNAAPTILYMRNSTAAMDITYVMPSVGGWLNGYIPVAKGDKFSYSVSGSFSTVRFYFVKCKGD